MDKERINLTTKEMQSLNEWNEIIEKRKQKIINREEKKYAYFCRHNNTKLPNYFRITRTLGEHSNIVSIVMFIAFVIGWVLL